MAGQAGREFNFKGLSEIRFTLEQGTRLRYLVSSFVWVLPLMGFGWFVLRGMEYDLRNVTAAWDLLNLIMFSLLCLPSFWFFTPEQLKGFTRGSGWVLQLDKTGALWRYHLFFPVSFKWDDVEMVSLQRKGFGGKPYLVLYPKKDYHPALSLPQFAQVVQQTKEKFGDRAGLSIDIGKLGVNEERFRAVLEEMMRGSGFQIMREGRDVFYKKLTEESGLQMPQYRPHG